MSFPLQGTPGNSFPTVDVQSIINGPIHSHALRVLNAAIPPGPTNHEHRTMASIVTPDQFTTLANTIIQTFGPLFASFIMPLLKTWMERLILSPTDITPPAPAPVPAPGVAKT